MNYAPCRRSAPVARNPSVIMLFAFKAVGKREGEGRDGRGEREEGRAGRGMRERCIQKLVFLAAFPPSLPFSTTLSSRHRNFPRHPFVAALAKLLLKPAALLRNFTNGGGGSSKVKFQRQLKDGLKMSEESAWQLH